jgi:general secretion pathway protein G
MIRGKQRQSGFTFLELLIVMTIMAIMAMVAIPTFMTHIHRARETRLQSDLMTIRDAIDKYTVDQEKAPQRLEDLVEKGYLRALPEDPITKDTGTWQLEMESESAGGKDVAPGIRNVRSGADGEDSQLKPYREY